VLLAVLGVRVRLLGAAPLLAVRPPAPAGLRVLVGLPAEAHPETAPPHCMQKQPPSQAVVPTETGNADVNGHDMYKKRKQGGGGCVHEGCGGKARDGDVARAESRMRRSGGMR